MATPLISIIVPVYNVERYLRECLDSIVNQSLQEIEIICVNDGATDRSLAILREYEAVDSRIKIIDRQSNEGLATARNVGMKFATGKYLLFVDSDDYVDSELCRKVFGCAEGGGADLVIYDYVVFAGDEPFNRKFWHNSSLSGIDALNKEQLLTLRAYAGTKLIRHDYAKVINLRFPDGLYYEDVPVHWALITMSRKIVLLPECLYAYRRRSNAITYRRDWKLTDWILVYDLIKEFLIGRSLYSCYRDQFLKQQLETFYSVYDKIDRSFKRNTAKLIQERMTDEHWCYIKDRKPLYKPARDFFLSWQGDIGARLRRSLWLSERWCYRHWLSKLNKVGSKFQW